MQKKLSDARAVGALMGLCLFASACGPQPKPDELIHLEALRASEESAQINLLAPEAYGQCTQLTQQSVLAWQDGNAADAKLYASLGQRQYSTARVAAGLSDAQRRTNAANLEAEKLKKELEGMKERQSTLERNIENLKQSIAKVDGSNVEAVFEAAMAERQKAVEVEAAKYQQALFAQADAKLKEAIEHKAYGRREQAGAMSAEAKSLFAQAYAGSKSDFDRQQAAERAKTEKNTLIEEAKQIVGPSFVIAEPNSVLVVVASAFDKDSAELFAARVEPLRLLAALAQKYASFGISIEGYTRAKTRNDFELSQRRADVGRDIFIGQGVDFKRIMTTAKGKSQARYSDSANSRAQNDRLEIRFTLP